MNFKHRIFSLISEPKGHLKKLKLVRRENEVFGKSIKLVVSNDLISNKMAHDRKRVVIIYPKGFERKNEDLSKIQTSTETLNIDNSDALIVKEESNFEEASNESEMSNVTYTGMSKPKLSYAKLISEALLNSPNGMLILSDIYKSISARHPYYQMDLSSRSSWQKTVRQN